jgi:hypothetical protein
MYVRKEEEKWTVRQGKMRNIGEGKEKKKSS